MKNIIFNCIASSIEFFSCHWENKDSQAWSKHSYVGSITVPTLLIPLILGLYNVKLKNPGWVMLLPAVIAIFWYLNGIAHPTAEGYPGFIFDLDPMYPGIITSLVLYLINKY